MPARRQREKCPACGGRKQTRQFVPGSPETQPVLRACVACGGRGYRLKPLSPEQRLRAVETDVRRLRSRVRELEREIESKVPHIIPNEGGLELGTGSGFTGIEEVHAAPVESRGQPKLGPQRQLP